MQKNYNHLVAHPQKQEAHQQYALQHRQLEYYLLNATEFDFYYLPEIFRQIQHVKIIFFI